MRTSSIEQIRRTREWLAVAGNVIFGSVFLGGLIALVVFLDSLLAPLKS